MNAALQNGGIRLAEERQDEMAERGNVPAVRPKFHVSFGTDPRSKQERRADLDVEAVRLNVSRMCFV